MTAPRRKYGDGTVRRHGRGFQIRWYVDGRPACEQVNDVSEKDALKLLQRRQAAVSEGRPTGREGERLTLKELKAILKEDYAQRERKSWSRAGRAFDAVAAVFGETCKVSRLTSDRLHQYLTARLDAGFSRSTVQKELAAVKRALNLAVERGLLPFRVAFPRIGEIQNARCEFIEGFEWALARPELPEWWQDMGDMAMEMGWRPRAEFLGLQPGTEPLTWARVDWDRGTVRLAKYGTKNSDARVFPFAEAPLVKAALERRRAYTSDVEQRTGQSVPWVFHVDGQPISEHRFYTLWRAACKKASVLGADGQPKHPHDFRRSAVRALETGGVARSIAKRLVGHRTDAMYARYAITTEDDLRDAVRNLHKPAPAPEHEGAGL